jgi:hypothetical protein
MTLKIAVFKSMFSRRYLAGVCALLLIATLTASCMWASRHQLFTLSGNKSQGYTELFFVDAPAAPGKLEAGQQYKIPFIITNRTGTVKKYTFRASILSHNQTRSLSSEAITVEDGEVAKQQVVFTASENQGPAQLSISLLNENQHITLKMGQ